MAKTTEGNYLNIGRFLAGLREAVNALPSEAQKEETRAGCARLIEFLNDLQKGFQQVPSKEEMEGVRAAIQTVEEFLSKAKTDLLLASFVGLRQPQAAKRRREPLTEQESLEAKDALSHLESLPIDSIQSELQDEQKYTPRRLHAIAFLLGIRSTKGLNRDALSHQISTGIANKRGYRALRGES
jgi:hypothetical protein